jgi:hypothetical protein
MLMRELEWVLELALAWALALGHRLVLEWVLELALAWALALGQRLVLEWAIHYCTVFHIHHLHLVQDKLRILVCLKNELCSK